jgi:LPXTG-motif cell wall-anchored protein
MPLKVGALVSSTLVVAMATGGVAAAAPTCDAADFTTNGVLDLDGYLACLAGTGGGGGSVPVGGLPATGSDMMRIVALGIGASVVGVGALVAAKRRNPVDAPDAIA